MQWSLTMELGSDDEGRRLDRVLRKALKDLPLSAIHRALRKGQIKVDGSRKPPEHRCRQGERIECKILSSAKIGTAEPEEQRPGHRISPLSSLSVVYEDKALLFVNKPQGQLVHGSAQSLEAFVRSYLEGKLPPSLSFVPGPLHRLDRNTSGLVCFSKSLEGAIRFSAALREGRIGKTYLAVLEGSLESPQRWNDILVRGADLRSRVLSKTPDEDGTESLTGQEKAASTEILPLASSKGLSLAALRLHSGRTHQIRVQSAHHGFPLAGDVKYGAGRKAFPYFLHAFRLSFAEALYEGLPQRLEAPFPEEFLEIIEKTFFLRPEEVYSLMRQSNFQEAD
ncbi:MAG: RluA family pseudouridine synthase [Spirochaetales bacterium]|nr:RluA family pseudouridine synthase [Spirochaetales bacterium]